MYVAYNFIPKPHSIGLGWGSLFMSYGYSVHWLEQDSMAVPERKRGKGVDRRESVCKMCVIKGCFYKLLCLL